MRTPKPKSTHRVPINATVAPETAKTLRDLTRPGDGLGQTIDRAIEALKKEEKKT